MMPLLCCLVFKYKLCTWWLGQSGVVQRLFYALFVSGEEANSNAQTSTIPGTFTVISHSFQMGTSIGAGFTFLKIRGTPKHLYRLSSSFFRNAVYLHFTQPYSTAGLIFLLLFTAGDRGARTTSSSHNGVLDGCSLFPSHQALFDEWFMSRNLWKRLPHANVN